MSKLTRFFEVTKDINILLCHRVVIKGALKDNIFLEHNSTLDTIVYLRPFLSNESYNVTSSDGTKCHAGTTVTKDMYITVTAVPTDDQTIVEITVDRESGLTPDEVDDAVKGALGKTVAGVTVVEDENSNFIVSIIVAKDTASSVKSVFEDCVMQNNSNSTD